MKRINLVLIVIASLGCADGSEKAVPPPTPTVEDVRSLCDGTEDIVLGMRLNAFGNQATSRIFYYENGVRYIYMNGKCEFWTWGILPKKVQVWNGNRMDITTGKLDEDEALRFLNLISWQSWNGLDGTHVNSPGLGEDTQFHFYSGDLSFDFSFKGATVNPEYSDRLPLVDGMFDAMEYLIERGQPYGGEELRLYIEIGSELNEPTWNHLDPPPFIFDWVPPFSIRTFSEEQYNYCAGGSRLIQKDEAKALFDNRNKYRIEADKVFSLPFAILDEDRLHHEIHIRDVLPFENELGFVPFNGRYETQNCEEP